MAVVVRDNYGGGSDELGINRREWLGMAALTMAGVRRPRFTHLLLAARAAATPGWPWRVLAGVNMAAAT